MTPTDEQRPAARSSPASAEVRHLVDEQAEDEGLWFIAQTAPEAYLQQELRRLHAVIEASPAPAEGLREALKAGGWEPDTNVCGACFDPGARHDLNDRCLDCSCRCFSSMTDDEIWTWQMDRLAARLSPPVDRDAPREDER